MKRGLREDKELVNEIETEEDGISCPIRFISVLGKQRKRAIYVPDYGSWSRLDENGASKGRTKRERISV